MRAMTVTVGLLGALFVFFQPADSRSNGALPAIQADSSLQNHGKPPLDFGFFKDRVEPIFLKRRIGHVRCVLCHSQKYNTGGAAQATLGFKLEPISPGSKFWTDEQSRKNFEVVSRLVAPGEVNTSVLLTYPLAHDAGGAVFHSGGREFRTRDDPDWRTMEKWVLGRREK